MYVVIENARSDFLSVLSGIFSDLRRAGGATICADDTTTDSEYV